MMIQNRKMKYNYTALRAVFCTALFLVAPFVLWAQTEKNTPETDTANVVAGEPSLGSLQRVYDDALLFSMEEIEQLETLATDFRTKTNMDAAFVTTDDAGQKTARAYADDFYDEYDFGTGIDKSGFLFLIDMDNREIYISTCGSMIDILSDSRIESTLDAAYPYMKMPDFFGACKACIEKVAKYVDSGVPAGQHRVNTDNSHDGNYSFEDYLKLYTPKIALYAAVFAALAVLITCIVIIRKYHFKKSTYEYPFRKMVTMNLTIKEDTFKFTNVEKHYINTSSSGGSGNRSSTHTSSSGRSHGGGGRSF